jgi:site-specific DNA recombinase
MDSQPVVAVGYVRVSTQDQVKEGFSLAAQRRRIESYCKAAGWALGNVFADEGVTGTSIDRPAFTQMLNGVLAGGVDRIVFVKLDRLGRCAWRLGELQERLEVGGVGLVSISEQFDTTTSLGRCFWLILAAFAQLERDLICERAAAGLNEKARQGRGWITGRPPYGYRVRRGELVAEAQERLVVRFIFRKAGNGMMRTKIARLLNEDRLPSPGGKAWHDQAVRRILRNPVYRGRYTSLGTHTVRTIGLVSRSQWDAAQRGSIVSQRRVARRAS